MFTNYNGWTVATRLEWHYVMNPSAHSTREAIMTSRDATISHDVLMTYVTSLSQVAGTCVDVLDGNLMQVSESVGWKSFMVTITRSSKNTSRRGRGEFPTASMSDTQTSCAPDVAEKFAELF